MFWPFLLMEMEKYLETKSDLVSDLKSINVSASVLHATESQQSSLWSHLAETGSLTRQA